MKKAIKLFALAILGLFGFATAAFAAVDNTNVGYGGFGCGMMGYGGGPYGGYGGSFGWILGILVMIIVVFVIAVIFWLTYKWIVEGSIKKGGQERHRRH